MRPMAKNDPFIHTRSVYSVCYVVSFCSAPRNVLDGLEVTSMEGVLWYNLHSQVYTTRLWSLMSAIEIVRAQPHDAATLKLIAVAAKSHWGYPEHLIAEWAASPIISPMDIAHSPVYVAYNAQQAIGWYRLLIDRSPAILEDLWVMPSWIGRGIGRALFEHAIAYCHAHGVTQMELDADPNAVGFYLRMGGRVIGERISEWQRLVPRIRFDLAPLR